MHLSLKNKSEIKLPLSSLVISVFAHLIIAAIGISILFLRDNPRGVYSLTEVNTIKGGSPANAGAPQNLPEDAQQAEPEENRNVSSQNENTKPGDNGSTKNPTDNSSGLIEGIGFDSSGVTQIYSEPTLNVRIKYPVGWVYVDQRNKNKLDGVTFWSSATNINPPPYVHVEVVEKYMFNPQRYKYKFDFETFTGYYNDPEGIEDQFTQTIYIRTDDDEDYTIKLIMRGEKEFRQFQPAFFAMVKSFSFGKLWF